MKKNILYLLFTCSVFFAGCDYDNFDEPNAILSGRVIYDGKAVGVRTNGPQLEAWQDGYALRTFIPIFIAHDGTYSVNLFNGRYKLVRKSGSPWEAQLNDTITVDVHNNTVLDVPVNPFFVINGESFQHQSGTITANFIVDKIVETANIAEVRLYIGKSLLTDHNRNDQSVSAVVSDITAGQQAGISAQLSQSLANLDYVYVRVGVRANVSNEFSYTQVQRINLN